MNNYNEEQIKNFNKFCEKSGRTYPINYSDGTFATGIDGATTKEIADYWLNILQEYKKSVREMCEGKKKDEHTDEDISDMEAQRMASYNSALSDIISNELLR